MNLRRIPEMNPTRDEVMERLHMLDEMFPEKKIHRYRLLEKMSFREKEIYREAKERGIPIKFPLSSIAG